MRSVSADELLPGQSKCHFDAANPQLRRNLHVINVGLRARHDKQAEGQR